MLLDVLLIWYATWAGDQFGCRDNNTAAAPETMGAEKEVPDAAP